MLKRHGLQSQQIDAGVYRCEHARQCQGRQCICLIMSIIVAGIPETQDASASGAAPSSGLGTARKARWVRMLVCEWVQVIACGL